jgi:uncharacterized membrane protein
MAPLIVMLVIWLTTRVIGFAGWWAQANSWRGALRAALAGMFLFTAVSHFHPRTRADLIQMVPPGLPEPALLVTATGVLELAGAAGLLVPSITRAAAFGLIGLLAAMLPANVHAAQQGLIVAGRPASPHLAPATAAVLDVGAVVDNSANEKPCRSGGGCAMRVASSRRG